MFITTTLAIGNTTARWNDRLGDLTGITTPQGHGIYQRYFNKQ